jgi:D-arabinose 1-dehydrogenase-like Zn-dependent alcohol dehydrogenase
MSKCKSMVLESPRIMRMHEFDIPEVAEGDMLLKVDLVGICGGDPIEYEGRNRKVHYPLILGHERYGSF